MSTSIHPTFRNRCVTDRMSLRGIGCGPLRACEHLPCPCMRPRQSRSVPSGGVQKKAGRGIRERKEPHGLQSSGTTHEGDTSILLTDQGHVITKI